MAGALCKRKIKENSIFFPQHQLYFMQVEKREKVEKYAKIIMGLGSRSRNKIMPTLGRTGPVV